MSGCVRLGMKPRHCSDRSLRAERKRKVRRRHDNGSSSTQALREKGPAGCWGDGGTLPRRAVVGGY
jgi:hypothetical protein